MYTYCKLAHLIVIVVLYVYVCIPYQRHFLPRSDPFYAADLGYFSGSQSVSCSARALVKTVTDLLQSGRIGKNKGIIGKGKRRSRKRVEEEKGSKVTENGPECGHKANGTTTLRHSGCRSNWVGAHFSIILLLDHTSCAFNLFLFLFLLLLSFFFYYYSFFFFFFLFPPFSYLHQTSF